MQSIRSNMRSWSLFFQYVLQPGQLGILIPYNLKTSQHECDVTWTESRSPRETLHNIVASCKAIEIAQNVSKSTAGTISQLSCHSPSWYLARELRDGALWPVGTAPFVLRHWTSGAIQGRSLQRGGEAQWQIGGPCCCLSQHAGTVRLKWTSWHQWAPQLKLGFSSACNILLTPTAGLLPAYFMVFPGEINCQI